MQAERQGKQGMGGGEPLHHCQPRGADDMLIDRTYQLRECRQDIRVNFYTIPRPKKQ